MFFLKVSTLALCFGSFVSAGKFVNPKFASLLQGRQTNTTSYNNGQWTPDVPGYTSQATTLTSTEQTSTTTEVQITKEPTTTGWTSTESVSDTTTTTSHISPPAGKRQIVSAYYPDWQQNVLPPEAINFALYDRIDFAFAILDSNYDLKFTLYNSADILRRLVTAAHAANTKVSVSIGGWTGSQYFSPAVSTAQGRSDLVSKVLSLINTYSLDGVDIDWEYPGTSGAPGNNYGPSDSANFLLFLQALRTAIGDDKYISACTSHRPFVGSDGSPLSDVSQFAAVMDSILVMNYDVWGSSSNPGPNSPLDNACGSSQQPSASQKESVKAWTSAGMPASKIVMGIAAYGYASSSSAQSLVTRRSLARWYEEGRKSMALRRHRRRASVASYVGNQISFRQMIEAGTIRYDSSENLFVGINGFVRKWDRCSSTPYLINSDSGIVISYDDPKSLYLKGEHIRLSGIGGIGIWEISGDSANVDLTRAVRTGMGI